MTASRRVLAILAVLTVLLGVLVGRDLARETPGAVDRALVPSFDPATTTALAWSRGTEVSRIANVGGRWQWQPPSTGAVDRAALDEVMSTLRAARWHREAAASAAGPIHAELVIEGPVPVTLGLAGDLAGSEQAWIVRGDRALLVDRWVTRALDPAPLALHVRRPFPDPAAAPTIELESGAVATAPAFHVALTGQPRRLAQPPMMVSQPLIDALEHALAGLEISRVLAHAAPAGDGAFTIHVGAETAFLDRCPEDPQLARLRGAFGDGCLPLEHDRELRAATAALLGDPASVIERRPAPIAPTRVTLADGAVLELARRPRIAGRDADPTRVAELVAALQAPAETAVTDPAPAVARLQVDGAGGEPIRLELLGRSHVRRVGEALALVLPAERYAILARTSADLRDLQLWIEEPTTVSELTIDARRYHLAASGSWVRDDGPLREPARFAELVEVLAAPRALGAGPASFPTVHTITVRVVPPVGEPVVHALEVGAPTGRGCPARSGGDSVLLPRLLCDRIPTGR